MKYLQLVGVLFFATGLFAQPEYSRNSLTLMAVDFNEKHSGELLAQFSKLPPPDKFYNNPLQNPVISMGGIKRPVAAELPELLQYMPPEYLIKMLDDQKVAQQILSTWFNRQADGSFNVDVLKQRGLYNANDNDFMAATASKRGETTLMDMGLKLVNQSYVLVYDYFEIMTMDEYYDLKAVPAKSRTSNGYKVKAKSYLFRLDFGEEVAGDFFKNYWVNAGDPDKAVKAAAFDRANFKWIHVANQRVESEVSQFNPDQLAGLKKQKSREEQLYAILIDVMDKVTPQMEARNESFRVKAMVSGVHPISAKIGKKEGLGFDQRYFVFENRENKDGTIAKKRVAVVKSMKVVDNRQVTTGASDASEFYKIFGGKVDNMGMFMEQKNDAGLNLFLGYTPEGMAGYTGRMEYFISKFMGGMVSPGKSGKALSSILVYVEGAYDNRKYPDLKEDAFEFTRVSLGLGKDIYLMSAVFLEPFVGYGIEFTDWQVEDEKFSFETGFAEMGMRLGIHLSPSVQLMGSYKYNLVFKTKVKNESTETTESFDYDEFFEDRIDPGYTAGIRFMF